MITETLVPSPQSFKRIAELLNANEVVALPTETVYGLAGNAFSALAVKKIFSAKERPFFDPLIVHLSESYLSDPRGLLSSLIADEIIELSHYSEHQKLILEKMMREYWPGPLTLVVPRGRKIPDEVTANQNTVAIRCPAHPHFQTALQQVSFPLAAPSANRFGRISPTEAKHVIEELEGRILAVLDGGSCTVGLESTIVRYGVDSSVTLLRPGKISAREIESAFSLKVNAQPGYLEQTQNQLAPGMLEEHYAPRTPLYLISEPWNADSLKQPLGPKEYQSEIGILSMGPLPSSFDRTRFVDIHELSLTGDISEAARNLYWGLRALDSNPKVKLIVSDVPPTESSLSAAIRDRLKRASRNKPEV